MKEYKPVILYCSTILVLSALCIGGFLLDRAIMRSRRDEIFCQQIHAGMNREEVNLALETVGPFQEAHVSAYLDNVTRIRIDFEDRLIRHFAGGNTVILVYVDNLLVGRYHQCSLSDHCMFCQEDLEKYYGNR